VRQRGHDVGLEIIGDVSDPGYAKVLRDRAKAAGPWVQMHHGISRGELEQRVGNCRFGLHTMRDEHFGIAVAELVRAGCIVFVPGDGGQVEIIGKEPALMFETVDQAVERISAVLENPGLQARLGARLSEQMHAFNEEQFMQQLRDIVQAWVSENRKQREA
jgi:glycosyltransferase involved in cell wall biosynthesis